MPYSTLLYDVADNVVSIRLNQPETLNAMTEQLGAELYDALCRAEGEARAIVLCASGRAFCSGANLGEGGFDLADTLRDAGSALEPIFNRIIMQMRQSELPVITAVQGATAGVGCAIALAGDLIVASEDAYFFQAFAKIGLVPDGGSSYLIARAIGRPRAMEMMLLGSRVQAAQALDWGLINRVVALEALDSVARDLALQLARGPQSIAFIKQLAWSALDASFAEALIAERFAQRKAGRTADFAEGVAAFREKRVPAFIGR